MPKGGLERAALSRVKVVAQKITKVRSEILVLGLFQDMRPLTGLAAEIDWIHNGILSRLLLHGKIRGVLGETTLLATQRKLHAHKVLVMGLGKRERFTDQNLREVYSRIYQTLSQLHIHDCAVELFSPSDSTLEGSRALEAVLRCQSMDPGRRIEMTFLVPDEEKAQRIQQHVYKLAGNA